MMRLRRASAIVTLSLFISADRRRRVRAGVGYRANVGHARRGRPARKAHGAQILLGVADRAGRARGPHEAPARNHWLAPLVTLALTSGARRGELETLTWEQLDLQADYGLSLTMRLVRTKSGKPRVIPLMADAVAALVAVSPSPNSARAGSSRGNGPGDTCLVSHAPAHGGLMAHDSGHFATVSSGNPRAQQPEPDREIQPSGDGAYPGRPGPPGGAVKPVAKAHGMAQLAECATQVPVAKA